MNLLIKYIHSLVLPRRDVWRYKAAIPWCVALFLLSAPLSFASFDKAENWGFDQGGGFRQGNFTGKDAGMVVADLVWDGERNHMAVAGALGDQWAARVYKVNANGPQLVAGWDGNNSMPFSTVTQLAWLPESGELVCGVEYIERGKPKVRVLTLDINDDKEFIANDISGMEAFTELVTDSNNTQNVLVVGSGLGGARCLSVNPRSGVSSFDFSMDEIIQPIGMAVLDGRFWIVGNDTEGKLIIELYDDEELISKKSFGKNIFVSDMKASGDKLFIVGRSLKSKKEKENFFLKSFKWNGRTIKQPWAVRAKDSGGGSEVGTSLLPLSDGGILVGGYFDKTWFLGQRKLIHKLAMFTKSNLLGNEFDSFIARYDSAGNLLFAQSSSLPGSDFLVGMTATGEDDFTILGNRKIDGGFGPYLSKIKSDGNSQNNVLLVEPTEEDKKTFSIISWEPQNTIRFGEPIDGKYFSASAMGDFEFQYQLNGIEVEDGDRPVFLPGDINMTARLFRDQVESNATTVSMIGLKGRPYLKIGFEQEGKSLNLKHELFGLHPIHSADTAKMESLGQKISYELVSKDGNQKIMDGTFFLETDFTGNLEIIASFEGDEHYEDANRRITIFVEDGMVSESSGGNAVRLQVKDLDGWQSDLIVNRGSEAKISATQGFGTNRKFNRWVEFSDELQKLRTARVQSPFNIRTSLIAEGDMTLFAHYNFTFVGTAINGYLGGSKVFLDFNLNGLLDDDEPFGFSTNNGGFELEVSDEIIHTNDKNGNGVIDENEGMLVVLEGIDHSSNLPFSISYRAPPGYSVITSISTLVAELVDEGVKLSDAEADVRGFLGLSENIELSSFEPLRKVFDRGQESQGFTLRATQLANIMNEGSRFIKMKTRGRISRVRGAELIVSALSDKIIEQTGRRSSDASLSVDLTDSNLLLGVITSAETVAEQEVDQTETVQLTNDSSIREQLIDSQPAIAEAGNSMILSQMVEQITSANTMLSELSDNPEVDPTAFKALASASQTILDELGSLSSNTIFDTEVNSLNAITGAEASSAQDIIEGTSVIKALPDSNSFPSGEDGSLAAFSLSVLQDVSSQSGINVYAPNLTNTEITSSDKLNDEFVLGNLSAVDPEGSNVSYSIIGENPDFDGDDVSILSVSSTTGQIQIQDFDDLKLMTSDTVQPIIRVTDEKGLFYDQQITVNLADWTYLAGRLQIEDASLTVPINVTVGTSVHVFSNVDSEGGSIEYLLVSGEGDGNNSLFTLDTSGKLKTAVVHNQKLKNSLLNIRIQVKDSRYNTAEKSFSVKVVSLSDNNLGSSGLELFDGQKVDGLSDWWNSQWFGSFYTAYYPWVYNQGLGWVYVSTDQTFGTWLYRERLGWIWTMKDVFPALYMNKRKEWTFLDTLRSRTTLYDYSYLTWFELDTPVRITAGVTPSNGGTLSGLGYYYRWEDVKLEAKPKAGYNFGGWSGGLSSIDKVQNFEATQNLVLDVSFIPILSDTVGSKEALDWAIKAINKMDHLTDDQKKKSIFELHSYGKSTTSGLSIIGE